jgi:hypothetical protein
VLGGEELLCTGGSVCEPSLEQWFAVPLSEETENCKYFGDHCSSIIFTVLDIMHRPVSYVKHNLSGTEFCLPLRTPARTSMGVGWLGCVALALETLLMLLLVSRDRERD